MQAIEHEFEELDVWCRRESEREIRDEEEWRRQ
jgi:hypothetical protein